MSAYTQKKDWLMPAALILFLLTVILIPFAAERTYAGRSDSPDHTLTYTTGSLTWDSVTGVDPDTGVAELSLFDSVYQNVEGENGDKVVAPGTEGKNIVRLKNDEDYAIKYVAVIYRIKDEDTLPVVPVLTDDAVFADTTTYPLPDGVTQAQVVRAVTGTVGANELQDFDIMWLWEYYESDERDRLDTVLGNKAAWEIPDEVQAGLYIVVEEGSDPENPDPENPDPENPDPENPDPENPDPENPDPENPDDPEAIGSRDDPAGGSRQKEAGASDDPDDPYLYPDIPNTGDTSNLALYLLLMAVSGVLLLLMMLDGRKAKQ